jgi:propanol-preferring alcohol dehydrogenase
MVDNVQVGDRVGIQFLRSACGFCEFCVSGWESVCVAQTNAGFTEDGCMGEFALGVGAYVAKIPQQLTDDQAARKLCFLSVFASQKPDRIDFALIYFVR